MTSNKACAAIWLRRDLRLEDNAAIWHATQSGLPLLFVFIFDKEILSKLPSSKDPRVQFIHKKLQEIKTKLQEHGSNLLVKYGTTDNSWEAILKEYNIKAIYCNEDYEPQAIKRDKIITELAYKQGVKFHSYKDQCIFAKNDILKKDATPYTIYTPYKRKWLEKLYQVGMDNFHTDLNNSNLLQIKQTHFPSLTSMGFIKSEIIVPSLNLNFDQLKNYQDTRDFPSLNSTSKISTHLRFGTISIRQCVGFALETNETWLSELIWREFFMQILYHFPHVTDQPFKSKYAKIPWINDKNYFDKWKNGMTGYPLVDAGMRELNETGFMHNRVRMVAASFLVKHLLIDWRWGGKYFADKLLDFELASNNGNWQWAAGTGCDAAPYFRVFNPEIQQKKFDAKLRYIRQWVQEFDTTDYPIPIVDHKSVRNRAIETYKKALDSHYNKAFF